ncbi:hypothetical protein O6H91_01G059400 [Diphasiastrum complanatum]|uniref:Uncharacterized protein n=2 Tax=Diphasiastrum complanatum TaxID=34168 RepID=A0ACC2ERM9_DIPCM|nr:hypothetical protein O6H91_Y063100 [Diphasiastrum complanatum]KAJ7297339.1 hypothetical protein O6H91_Y063100 [Diphasiastrum complanatum]KAJ7297340.1 hypothetical protein O6H91_Y063100 [Diphasiastrum complanatum]KAJ7297341.1 hypothetical protein O6H91_Y063100 [Diphasiastrum complanatum]KAJ7569062.1 hypothetical protein O6H91_01G059400 [Diphasiastrum complanatum]
MKMESPTVTSVDGSCIGSGQSVKVQICQAASHNSSQNELYLKAHDYIGLSEVSSRPMRAEQSAMHEEQQKMVVGETINLNLQETELRLGPPKRGPPSQPKQETAYAAMNRKEDELLNAASRQSLLMSGPNYHASVQKDSRFCEKGQTGLISARYMKELGSESLKRRYAEDNLQVLDLGIGLSSQIMPYPQEEVGENKVSCNGGRNLQKFTRDSQEQLNKNQAKTNQQVLVSLEPFEDEQKKSLAPQNATGHHPQDTESSRPKQLLGGSALGPSEYGLYGHSTPVFPERGLSHLQELSAAHRFWQARMMLRAADSTYFPRNYELPSPYFSQELDTKTSFGAALNCTTAVRAMPSTPRNTVAGAKRVFSEAITDGAVMLNGAAKVANSGVTNAADSESRVFSQQLKHQQPFSWSSTKQPLKSWPLGLDHPTGAEAAFGPFPSPGQSPIKADASIISPRYPYDSPPEKSSATGQKPPSESGHGIQQAQATADDDMIASAPRAPVGWPPVQSFRKNSLPPPKPKKAVETKPAPVAASSIPTPVAMKSECLFVKVYMDGLPFGRKVDLRTYDDYEKLSMALEEMFKGFINGQCGGKEAASSTNGKKLNFLCDSEYVITYEDKDGDLMLVGDVPWRMFIAAVRRLRIMKGSEAIGLAPRLSDNAK